MIQIAGTSCSTERLLSGPMLHRSTHLANGTPPHDFQTCVCHTADPLRAFVGAAEIDPSTWIAPPVTQHPSPRQSYTLLQTSPTIRRNTSMTNLSPGAETKPLSHSLHSWFVLTSTEIDKLCGGQASLRSRHTLFEPLTPFHNVILTPWVSDRYSRARRRHGQCCRVDPAA